MVSRFSKVVNRAILFNLLFDFTGVTQWIDGRCNTPIFSRQKLTICF